MRQKPGSLIAPQTVRSGFPSWLLGLLLVAITLVAYLPVWHAGFIWDDDHFLTANPLILASDGLARFWGSTEAPDYFPMTSSSLWLEWRLWGNHPLGYHLVNVFLHAASSVLLWRILSRLALPGAWLAAAIFALHPVNVESVAWITERKNTLAMLFYLSSLLAYLQFEDTGRRSSYWLAAGTFFLALLSKTAVVALPIVLLGLAWWRRGRVVRRDVLRALPFFGIALLLGLITIWFQYHRAIGSVVVREDPFWGRLAGAGWAVWFYLSKALWPLNLMFVYPRWTISPANPAVYLPGFLFVAVLAACLGFRRPWTKAILFALGYFVLLLVPVLGFLDIYFMRFSLVSDHWQYFAIIGPIALVAAGLQITATRLLGAAVARAVCVAGAVLLFLLGTLTWRQIEMYADRLTLWRVTVERNPGSALAQYNVGCELLERGSSDEALPHFQEAVRLQPKLADARNNLGNLLLVRGRVDEAIVQFEGALEAQPQLTDARSNLGGARLQQGQLDEAIVQFQKVLEINPDDTLARYNLGSALLKQRRADEAISQFQRALQLRPDFAEALFKLGSASLQKGRLDGALIFFKRALELNPNLAYAHSDVGTLLLQLGKPREALTHYQRAVDLQPANANFLNNLAWVLATSPDAQIRDGAKAVAVASQAARLGGANNPAILGTLAAAYAENGKFPEAIKVTEDALRIATARTNDAQAALLRSNLALFLSGSPFHTPDSAFGPPKK